MNWHSEEIEKIVRNALAEDIGSGDASTAATTPPRAIAHAHIQSRQTLVCAGLPLAETVFQALDREMEVACLYAEGSFIEPGVTLVQLHGNAAAILT
ncbi:MAG TPA: nicotinate-nucleotide diphosphorylase (carboxylating), partial [Candidatus Dormibacteraeota bacterium]|nr:nicotinate-nucleotide diphosphorylase (carboxylating) [Candidatus Dormibacteraeota bacterium]